MKDTQTKRRYVHPWYEDDGDTPGLGAGSPWAMLWAKAATHHGRPIFRANGEQRGMNVSYLGRYVGLVQNRIKNMSLLTIGVNLVFTTQ
jgi:hypothetical protein